MKILKFVSFAILGVVALVLLAGLMVKKEYTVERSATVMAPKDTVVKALRSFNTFLKWSPWAEYDPKATVTMEGVDGAIGSKYLWKGNDQVGSGSMELSLATDNRVENILVFKEPFESTALAYYNIESLDSASCKVTWGLNGSNPYPMNAILPLFMDMDKMIGADYEKGLAKFKTVFEK